MSEQSSKILNIYYDLHFIHTLRLIHTLTCSWTSLSQSSKPLLQHFVQIYVTLYPSFTDTHYRTLDLMTHYFKHMWKERTCFLFLNFMSTLPRSISRMILSIPIFSPSLSRWTSYSPKCLSLSSSCNRRGHGTLLIVHYYILVSYIPPYFSPLPDIQDFLKGLNILSWFTFPHTNFIHLLTSIGFSSDHYTETPSQQLL